MIRRNYSHESKTRNEERCEKGGNILLTMWNPRQTKKSEQIQHKCCSVQFSARPALNKSTHKILMISAGTQSFHLFSNIYVLTSYLEQKSITYSYTWSKEKVKVNVKPNKKRKYIRGNTKLLFLFLIQKYSMMMIIWENGMPIVNVVDQMILSLIFICSFIF